MRKRANERERKRIVPFDIARVLERSMRGGGGGSGGRRGSATTVLLVSRGHDVEELGQANCVSDVHDQREIRIGYERTRDSRPTKRRDDTYETLAFLSSPPERAKDRTNRDEVEGGGDMINMYTCVCMSVCVHASVRVCTYVYVCIYVCIYIYNIYIHTCVYTYIYTVTYICMYDRGPIAQKQCVNEYKEKGMIAYLSCHYVISLQVRDRPSKHTYSERKE